MQKKIKAEALGNEAGKRFLDLGLADETSFLFSRNQSILAHGQVGVDSPTK